MTGQITPAALPASSIGVERAAVHAGTRARSASPAPAGADHPLDGKVAPQRDPAPVARDDVERSRAALERFARQVRRELEFTVDEASGNTVITVRNKETGEVVRQIPAEEVLALARALAEGRPTLLDSTA
jgi:flagellar protein FlaG